MRQSAKLLAALLALSVLAACAAREAVPEAPAPSAAASAAASAGETAPSEPPAPTLAPKKPLREEDFVSREETPKQRTEPWEEDERLRAPLDRQATPADTQSVTIAAAEESYPAGEVTVRYTITNNSTQVLAFTPKYTIERQDKGGEWQRVSYPEGQEPQLPEEIAVLEPGQSLEAEALLTEEMAVGGCTYRVRRNVWVYDYEVNTERGAIPDKELGRFDISAQFAVA